MIICTLAVAAVEIGVGVWGYLVAAGLGLAVGASQVTVLAPLLLALSVAMCGLYAVVACSTVDHWRAV